MRSRGYNSCTSWVVAFSCSLIGFLVKVPMRIAGLLFIIIIERYETTRAYATIPIMVFGIIRSITGPLIGYLGQVFGLRNVTLVGCLLSSIGIAGCFFAEDIITVTIFLGFIYGSGFGLSCTLVPEILKQHFSRDLNLVNGMFLAGSCLGAIVMPQLVQLLIDDYGDSGMFLLLAGIMLHSVPVAILLKDPQNKEYHERISNLKERDYSVENGLEKIYPEESVTFISKNCVTDKSVERNDISTNCKYANENDDTVNSKLIFHVKTPEKNYKIIDEVQLNKTSVPKNNDLNTQSKSLDLCNIHESSSYSDLNKECIQVEELTKINRDYSLPSSDSYNGNKLEINKDNREIEYCQTFPEDHIISKTSKREKRHKLLLLFLDPSFHLTMTIQSFHAFTITLNWTILIDYCRDKGISTYDSLYFLMFLPLSEIIGSLTLNWISDRGFMTRTKYCVICHLTLSGLAVCIVSAHSYALMMTAVLVFGVVSGSLAATFPGMIHEFIEEDLQGLALASRYVLYAFLCLTKSPITGYFRETLGSYDWVYILISMCCLMCAILAMFTPVLAERRRNKKVKGDIALKL